MSVALKSLSLVGTIN